jgi:RHS repeat-associated protein
MFSALTGTIKPQCKAVAKLLFYLKSYSPVVFSLIFLWSVAEGQDYQLQTGSPVFSVLQPVPHGFVNLANGNLHVEIPLVSAPQRGTLPFSMSLVYDSRIWQVVNVGGSLIWKPTNIPNSWGGWRLTTSADPGTVTADQQFTACDQGQTLNISNFVWQSPDGTRRSFAINTAMDYGCGVNIPSGDAFAADASGYHMYVTNYATATVYAKDGTRVFPSVQDPNGNHFSTDANGNTLDTLGRTVVRKSVSGNQIFLDVLNSQGTTSRITIITKSIFVHTWFIAQLPSAADDQENITVLDRVQLPSGDVYAFGYDEGVNLSSPPGAFQPGYGLLIGVSPGGGYTYKSFVDSFGIVNRWVTNTADATISYIASSPSVPGDPGSSATLTRNGGSLTYGFTLKGGAWNTDIQAADGTHEIVKTYDFSQTPCPACPGIAFVSLSSTKEMVATSAGLMTKRTEYTYDSPQTANITSIKNWNYYPGFISDPPPANPDRQTSFTYVPLIGQNIIDRPASITIKDGLGNSVAQTNYIYDSTALATPTQTIVNNDTSVGPGRGNLTQISKWTGGTSFLSTFDTYDTTGQLVKVQDPAGNLTTIDYADRFYNDNGTSQLSGVTPAQATNAFPTTMTFSTGTIKAGYYFGSSQHAFTIDQNNQTTFYHYNEPLDRLTQEVGPKGWHAVTYSSLFSQDVFTGLSDTQPSSSCTGCTHVQTFQDLQGRITSSTLLSDPSGAVSSTVNYDIMGNVVSSSNPSRSGIGATTTNSYDVLYRLVRSQNADGSVARVAYENIGSDGATIQLCPVATYGIGLPILSTDEVGVKHEIWQNAFGNVIEADEADANDAMTIATCYKYDASGQLTQVVQGGLSRAFEYDRLGRVTKVTTPESGIEIYSYVKDDGTLCSGNVANVCKRVDARGITTSYRYDVLGRLTKKSYSDDTPTVFFNYDESSALGVSLTNTANRLSSISTQDATGKVLTGEVLGYDAAGSVANNSQCTPQNCGTGVFQNTYTTDQMGNIAAFNNNWGRNISSSLNNAAQVTSINVSGSDAAHPATILSNAKYNEFGKMTLAALGNGLTEAMDYSGARGWLESLRIGNLAPANSPGGNAASPGQGSVTIEGILRQGTGTTAGTTILTISGVERSISNGTGTPGTGTLTITGLEQLKHVEEIPAVGGTGAITINGAVQSKQVPAPATSAAGAILIGGLLKNTAATVWQNQDVTAITGNTVAGSGSFLSSDSGGAGNPIRSYYEAANQHVYSIYWRSSSASWVNEDLTAATGNTLAGSDTALSDVVLADGSTHVFYMGANQHVYQLLWSSGGGWSNQDLTTSTGNILAATGSALASLGDSNGVHLFYEGTNQHIYQLLWNPNVGWQNMDLTAITGNKLAVAGGKINALRMPDGTSHVFFIGNDQHMYRLYWSNAGSFAPAFLASSDFSDSQSWSLPAYYPSIRLGDVNGDGKADVCGRSSGGVICALNTGSGTFGAATQWEAGMTDAFGWNQAPYTTTLMLADVNGDGKADNCARGVANFNCEPSSGSSFGASVASPIFTDAQGWNAASYYYGSLRLGDVNGDGKLDICGRASGGIICGLNNGTGAFSVPTLWGNSSFTDAGSWNQAQYGTTIMLADINGDGKADVCGRASMGIVCALSTGNGFAQAYLASSDFSDAQSWNAGSYYYGSLRLADVNGDGKPDICGRSSGGVICALNYGNGTFAPARQWEGSFTDATGWSQPQYGSTMMFADINGDGKADVCGRGIAGIICEISNGGGGWQNQDLTVNSGGNVLVGPGSGIESIVDAAGCPHVRYIDPNQHVDDLYMAPVSGGCAANWTNQDLSALTGNTLAAIGSPLTSVGVVGDGLQHVFYIGVNRHIYRLYWNTAGTLLNQDLTALSGNAVAGTGSPLTSVAGTIGNSVDVFYFGTDQHVNHQYLGPGTAYDTGTVTVTITGSPFGSFTASAPYGLNGNNTAALVSSSLTNDPQTGLNRSSSPIHATLSGTLINFTAIQSGAISNYGLSSAATYDTAHFSSASFSGAPLTTTMTGGADPAMRTLYDSGTVKVMAGSYTANVPYGQVQIPGNATWSTQDLTVLAGGHPGTSSGLASFAGDAVSPQHVFYSDSSGHIHEQRSDSAGNWHDQDNTIASGSPVASSCGVLTSFTMPGSDFPEHVFYTDANRHIYEQYSDAIGHWHYRDNTVDSGATQTPWGCGVTGFSTPNSNSSEDLVYVDANGHVHKLWSDPAGNWHDQDNTVVYGIPAVAQNTRPIFFPGSTSFPEHLLYVDGSLHFREQYSDSGGLWHDRDLTVLAGGTNVGFFSAVAGFFDVTGSEHVFYGGSDSDIHHIWNDATGWHDEDSAAISGAVAVINFPNSLAGFVGSNGSKHLVFTGRIGPGTSDIHVYHLWSDSSGWHQEDLTLLSGSSSISPVMLTAFFDGAKPQVFLVSGDVYHLSASQSPNTTVLLNSTAAQIASTLVNDPNTGLNVAASPVTATVSGSTITLRARQGGQASNFAQSASSLYDTGDFATPSFSGSLSGPTLTGGTDGITAPLYDSGTLSVSINNHLNLIAWGEGATPQSMASALALDINRDPGAVVTAIAQGSIIIFTARVPGANTNYTYLPNMVHNIVDFPQPSFTFQPSAAPAPTLLGGSGGVFDTGTITVTVNGHSTTINYGQTDTFLADSTGIYNRLGNAINKDPQAAVWACCNASSSPLRLMSKKAGSSGNYSISVTSATNNSNFSGTSFPVSVSGATLSGGGQNSGGSYSDSGVATLSIGSYTVSTSYGLTDPFNNPCCGIGIPGSPPSTAVGIATALAQAINQDPNAPVIAAANATQITLTGAQISLVAKNGGLATNYSLTSSLVSNDPVNFPSTSFVVSPSSSTLTGGADKPNAAAASSSTLMLSFGFATLGWFPQPAPSCTEHLDLTINGIVHTACLNGSTMTPPGVAAAVAQGINTTLNSPVTATSSGANVVIQSISAGSDTGYPIAISQVSLAPLNVASSGPSLSGGAGGSPGGNNGFVYALDLGIDPSGTVFSANDSVNGNWSYFYDNLNRIQQASTPTNSYVYDYDRYGNRLHQTPSNGGNPLSLIYSNNQIVATGITYDASGNMTSDGTHQYAYDAENRLISVDGGQTARYIYNADGRRVRATVGSVSVDFIYDLSGRAVGIMAANGTLIRQEIGGLATYNDAAYFHHRDWLGNLRVVTDQTGVIRQTCTNLPYGDALACTPNGITPTDFTGYMHDGETNLDFANARYYTSQFGRFMSVDPVGGNAADPQSLNPYAYVRNGPLSATDPSGMSPDCPGGWCMLGPAFGGIDLFQGVPAQHEQSGWLSWLSGVFNFGSGSFAATSGEHFGGIPGFSGIGLCGIIAGCGNSFGDAGPPKPSSKVLAQEKDFNAALGAVKSDLLMLMPQLAMGGVPTKNVPIGDDILWLLARPYQLSVWAPFRKGLPAGYAPSMAVDFSQGYWCLSPWALGVGSKEPGASLGPLFGDVEHAREILSGKSITVQIQPREWVGSSYTTDFKNGQLWGPTVGTRGGSFSASYGYCANIHPNF